MHLLSIWKLLVWQDIRRFACNLFMLFPAKNSFGYRMFVKDFHNDGEHPEFANVKVYLGGPLLETEEDVTNVAKILHETYKSKVESNNIVTFMGHGTRKL